jgi:hypothetical protein
VLTDGSYTILNLLRRRIEKTSEESKSDGDLTQGKYITLSMCSVTIRRSTNWGNKFLGSMKRNLEMLVFEEGGKLELNVPPNQS